MNVSILIHRDTRFIVQGITGREAVNLTRENLDYGARIVGGVTPGRAGRDVYGVPPMRFLRNHRLQRVREELLSAREAQVSDVALRWGFSHFGRFAAEYRKRFGESPSQTLAGARRRAS